MYLDRGSDPYAPWSGRSSNLSSSRSTYGLVFMNDSSPPRIAPTLLAPNVDILAREHPPKSRGRPATPARTEDGRHGDPDAPRNTLSQIAAHCVESAQYSLRVRRTSVLVRNKIPSLAFSSSRFPNVSNRQAAPPPISPSSFSCEEDEPPHRYAIRITLWRADSDNCVRLWESKKNLRGIAHQCALPSLLRSNLSGNSATIRVQRE